MTFLERYKDKIIAVSESGCLLWVGASTNGGYGIVSSGKRGAAPIGAHRASYADANGPIPEGAHVLHRCDVRCCVNPDHLFLGDQISNMRDMKAKGRDPIGAKHGMATMTEEIVVRLRSEYRFRKVTAAMLATKYGLGKAAVRAAIKRQTWKHVQ